MLAIPSLGKERQLILLSCFMKTMKVKLFYVAWSREKTVKHRSVEENA